MLGKGGLFGKLKSPSHGKDRKSRMKECYTSSSSAGGSEFSAFNSSSSMSSQDAENLVRIDGKKQNMSIIDENINDSKDMPYSVPNRKVPPSDAIQGHNSENILSTSETEEQRPKFENIYPCTKNSNTGSIESISHQEPQRSYESTSYPRVNPSTEEYITGMNSIGDQWNEYYSQVAAYQNHYNEMYQQDPNSNGLSQFFQIPDGYITDPSLKAKADEIQRQMEFHYTHYLTLHQELAQLLSYGQVNGNQTKNDYLTYCATNNYSSRINDVNNQFLVYSRHNTIKSNRSTSLPTSIIENGFTSPRSNQRITSLGKNFKPQTEMQSSPAPTSEFNQLNINSSESNVSSNKRGAHTTDSGLHKRDLTISSSKSQQQQTEELSDYLDYILDDSQMSATTDDVAKHYQDPILTSGTDDKPNNISNSIRNGSSGSDGSIQSEHDSKFNLKGLQTEENRIFNKQSQNKYNNISQAELSNNISSLDAIEPKLQNYARRGSTFQQSTDANYSGQNFGQLHSNSASPIQYENIYEVSGPKTQYYGDQNINRTSMPNMNYLKKDISATANTASINRSNNRVSMPHFNQRNVSNSSIGSQELPVEIKNEIKEFIKLRKLIASGNKSLEYRLRWVKMLISATNNNLYSFINIKGEPVSSFQSDQNRQIFIKSAISHILKLIKEGSTKEEKEPSLFSNVYYAYACLLRNEYVNTFYQNFNITKDPDQCLYYLEKSLKLNPNNFKSLFLLGELNEQEFQDLEKGIEKYKESASLGYHKAIFKIAMIYLHIPQYRSVSFLKYLYELSKIDLESNEIELETEDLADLTSTVGYAYFELGKIYEGIYPDDLQPEDELVEKITQLAPVNYGKSLTCYNKASALDCTLAQIKLGEVYMNGLLGRPKNPFKSVQWFFRASSSPLKQKRHPDAMVYLAQWYMVGTNGLSKKIPYPNPDLAVYWCEKAIQEFNSENAINLINQIKNPGNA